MPNIKLTRSQQMALIDILIERIRDKDKIHSFIDVSVHPAVETTDVKLLDIISKE